MIARFLGRLSAWTTLTFRRAGASVPVSDLVSGARNGDPRCIGELYRRYRPPVLAFLSTLSPDDAEDLTQEVFLRLPQTLRGYEERGRFGAWLNQVAVNVYRTRRRSVARRREQSLPDRPLGAPEDDMGPVTRDDLFGRAMEGMPDDMREAWLLHCEGHKAGEIGRLLGISSAAAATRLSRARDYLRSRLTELM